MSTYCGRALLLAFFLAGTTYAQIPRMLSYQGVLTDTMGIPRPDGTYNILFSLYTLPSGGSPAWSEPHAVTSTRGLIAATLGETVPFTLSFTTQYWLGIQIGADPEMIPRVRLTAGAYSVSAAFADSARTVPNGGITGAKIASGQVVRSINGLRDALVLRTTGGASLATSGDTLTISAGASGGIQEVQSIHNAIEVLEGTGPAPKLRIRSNSITSGEIQAGGIGPYNIGVGVSQPGQAITNTNGTIAWGHPVASGLDHPITVSATDNLPLLKLENQGAGHALHAETDGAGNAVYGIANGSGTAANLIATGSGRGLSVVNSGTARTAFISAQSTLNPEAALTIAHAGNGEAIDATSASGTGILALANGSTRNAVRGVAPFGTGVRGEGFYNGVYGIANKIGVYGEATDADAPGVLGRSTAGGPGVKGEVFGVAGAAAIYGYTNFNAARAGLFEVDNIGNSAAALLAIHRGIGTAFAANHSGTSGNIALFQAGSSNVARIDRTGKGFFNGGTQTGGADVAEAFDVQGARTDYEPGDVLTLDPEAPLQVTKSSEPYSHLVVGVYATKPGVLLTEEDVDADLAGKVPLGVVGVIPTKVSGENGSIAIGDLLVTSATPGHAMKASRESVRTGMVIGKALQSFDGTGTGVIKVLVNVK